MHLVIIIVIIIIIIIVGWLKTVAPLHVLWQPLWITVLIWKSQRQEHDPPRFVEVGLGDYSSWDQTFCLPHVNKHHLQRDCGSQSCNVAKVDRCRRLRES